jgi:hypothetical protein
MDEITQIKNLRREGFSPVAISNMLQIDFLKVSQACAGVEPLRQIPDLPNLPPPPGMELKIDYALQQKIKTLRLRGYSVEKIASHLKISLYMAKRIGAKYKLPPLEQKK